jgi:hypothetical protein
VENLEPTDPLEAVIHTNLAPGKLYRSGPGQRKR